MPFPFSEHLNIFGIALFPAPLGPEPSGRSNLGKEPGPGPAPFCYGPGPESMGRSKGRIFGSGPAPDNWV
jgi:hypothetical protein